MIHKQLLAVALLAAAPAFASANFFVDFEKTWDYSNGDINNYYNGGTAADGTTGPNLGLSFVNVSGLSNDALGPYYTGAPSMQGVAYAHTFNTGDLAYLNVAAGANNPLTFYYSSPSDVVGAVIAYSGLNDTGTILGSIDLTANGSNWSYATLNFTGVALSFDFTATANLVSLDNISSVPEPEMSWLFVTGLTAMAALIRRTKASV